MDIGQLDKIQNKLRKKKQKKQQKLMSVFIQQG